MTISRKKEMAPFSHIYKVMFIKKMVRLSEWGTLIDHKGSNFLKLIWGNLPEYGLLVLIEAVFKYFLCFCDYVL